MLGGMTRVTVAETDENDVCVAEMSMVSETSMGAAQFADDARRHFTRCPLPLRMRHRVFNFAGYGRQLHYTPVACSWQQDVHCHCYGIQNTRHADEPAQQKHSTQLLLHASH